MMMMEDDNVDRISDLPDSLIHHILSLLPSTREAVQTTILSKRWQHLWTCVPVLIFHSPPAMSYGTFLKFIDNTLFLHNCNKIKKLELIYRYKVIKKDFRFSTKIRFATTKHVEQLILHSVHQEYVLPTFIFKNATSLLELRTNRCSFIPNGKVNWQCLTTLILVSCRLSDQAMQLILSGTPQLKIITLDNCFGFKKLAIASNSLKTLLVENCLGVFDLDISCPTLEIVYLLVSHNISGIACLLRRSPMLEMLTIDVTHYDQDNRDFGKNYWSDASVFSCLASHLKTININGFPKRDGKHKVMLNFIQFLLKNARVLEKMVVSLKDDGTGFH